jgi:ribosomal protein S27AE
MADRRITRNAAKCVNCGDVVESIHRHDFVRCNCGDIFVDGGLDYVRYGWMPGGGAVLRTQYSDD